VNAQLDELERWRESSPTRLVRELVGLLPAEVIVGLREPTE
jgi:hypothetical protein